MKVLDLQCALGHSFEGWFGSQADYDAQRARGLVACPVCSNSEITKMLSAPRLNLGHAAAPEDKPAQAHEDTSTEPTPGLSPSRVTETAADRETLPAVPTETLQQMQSAMLKMVRHVMANTEDVGPQFAEEARKIHYGEREARHIRGQATREETEALIDEGIDVVALPVPDHLKGSLQ